MVLGNKMLCLAIGSKKKCRRKKTGDGRSPVFLLQQKRKENEKKGTVRSVTSYRDKILRLAIGSGKIIQAKKKAGDEGHRLSVSIAGNTEKNEK